jgi:uncharacterized protein (TIRG00374 family)
VVSICLILLSNVARALRWEVMLRPLYGRPGVRPISLWRLTSDTAIGLTAGVMLGRIGEVVRPYLIAIQAGLPFSSQAAAWLVERVLDLLSVLLLCFLAVAEMPRHLWRPSSGYAFAAILAIFVIVLVVLRRQAYRRIVSALAFLPERHRRRSTRLLAAFLEGMECTSDPRSLALLTGYTLLAWGIVIASSFAFFRGFPLTAGIGLPAVLVLIAFMTFGSVAQIPGIGGGTQAALIVGLTSIHGLPLEAASGIAIAFWLVSTVAIVPVGLACAFHEKLNWSKLKLLSAKQILDDPET